MIKSMEPVPDVADNVSDIPEAEIEPICSVKHDNFGRLDDDIETFGTSAAECVKTDKHPNKVERVCYIFADGSSDNCAFHKISRKTNYSNRTVSDDDLGFTADNYRKLQIASATKDVLQKANDSENFNDIFKQQFDKEAETTEHTTTQETSDQLISFKWLFIGLTGFVFGLVIGINLANA